MYGYNIQSQFFETSLEEVWFASYEALNVYKPRSDDLEYYFILNSKGDTIKSDYKILLQAGDSLLVGAANNLYLYNSKLRKKQLEIPIGLEYLSHPECYQHKNYYRLISSSKKKIYTYDLTLDFEVISRDSIPIQSVSCKHIAKDICLLGTAKGEIIVYDFEIKKSIYQKKLFQNIRVSGFGELGDNKYLISAADKMLYVFDADNLEICDSMVIKNPHSSLPYSSFLIPYLDKDSCLWIGSDGLGVLNKDLKKEKFQHVLKFGTIQFNNRITSIKSNPENDVISIGTRGNGLYLLNEGLELIHNFIDRPYVIHHYWLNDSEIIYSFSNKIEKINIRTGKITAIYKFQEDDYIFSLEKIEPNSFLISLVGTSIYLLDISDQTTVENIIQINTPKRPFQRLKIDSYGNILVSRNDESILWYEKSEKQYLLRDSLLIPGGIRSISEPDFDSNHMYICNDHGIFKINKKTNSFTKIKDKDKILNGKIYGMIEGENQNIWYSTNKGIYRSDLDFNLVKVYSLRDGLQDMEFNTDAFMKDNQGRIWMGGVNGLNVFHPDDVKPSPTLATVCIDELQIDGKSSRQFGIGDYLDNIQVDYGIPFSIYFHAIDYGDPSAARLKYKLRGSDEDYVNVDNFVESIRYNKQAAGKYTLEILAANSDGVWNPEPRLINIWVKPPFWMTWWFILLASFGALWFTYYSFKSYYRRKIEKQNVKLREQELIIEAQQSLVKERNRIASEMHDDLGSGLTRIKYLSDRLIKTIKKEKEGDLIFRISNYSEELIRNMSEIIWAMNSRFDNFENLIAYIRRYSSEYLEEHKVDVTFEEIDLSEKMEISGEKRRNVFLAIKEALHNLVKYSGATKVNFTIENKESHINIILQEIDGSGFDLEKALEKGNGIYNMEKRMKDIGALEITYDNRGTRIIFGVTK